MSKSEDLIKDLVASTNKAWYSALSKKPKKTTKRSPSKKDQEISSLQGQLAAEQAKVAELAITLRHVQQQLYVLADPHDLDFSDEARRCEVNSLLSETFDCTADILTKHDAEVRRKALLDAKGIALDEYIDGSKEDWGVCAKQIADFIQQEVDKQ